MTSDAPSRDPAGLRILVAEDEALIAMALGAELGDLGAEVVGPAKTLARARDLAGSEPLDGAILDIDLRGELVYPAAEILAARGVPFVFCSGRGGRAESKDRFPGVATISKPASAPELMAALFDR